MDSSRKSPILRVTTVVNLRPKLSVVHENITFQQSVTLICDLKLFRQISAKC